MPLIGIQYSVDDQLDDLDRQAETGQLPDEYFGQSGLLPALAIEDCPDCRGVGEIGFNPSRGTPPDPQMETSARCPRCHGDGTIPRPVICDRCELPAEPWVADAPDMPAIDGASCACPAGPVDPIPVGTDGRTYVRLPAIEAEI